MLWLYQHNPAGQIASATRDNDAYAWTGHYAVDRAYTTNGLNQYTAAGAAAFGYDANGNLISDGTRTYLYDIENRLVSGNGATLSYDPLGRLYQVTGGGNTTRFLYDGDALVAEYDGAGAMTRRYVHWDGADTPIMSYAGAALAAPSYLHADHQGSIVAISGPAGAVQINRYDEYGIPAAANSGRFQYTGQVWLAELGMYHYKARIYSPTLGRFMQTDPIGYEGGVNLYGYVGNDSVNNADPTGLFPLDDPITFEAAQGRGFRAPTRGEAMIVAGGLAVAGGGLALEAACVVGGCQAAVSFLLTRAPTITEIGAGLAEGLAPGAGSATLAASAMSALMLAKQLTLTAQVGQLATGRGTVIAGGTAIRDINRIVGQYGGRTSDWTKVTSTASRTFSDGSRFSVHAYRNARTGAVIEQKVSVISAPCIGTRLCPR